MQAPASVMTKIVLFISQVLVFIAMAGRSPTTGTTAMTHVDGRSVLIATRWWYVRCLHVAGDARPCCCPTRPRCSCREACVMPGRHPRVKQCFLGRHAFRGFPLHAPTHELDVVLSQPQQQHMISDVGLRRKSIRTK